MVDVRSDTPDHETAVSAMAAPEDLRRGDFVSPLNEVFEFPTWLWNREVQVAPGNEFVRVQLTAREGGTPLKVKAICLPFVLLKTPKGRFRTVDIRGCQLVKLSADYARSAWKALRKRRKRKGSRSSAKPSP